MYTSAFLTSTSFTASSLSHQSISSSSSFLSSLRHSNNCRRYSNHSQSFVISPIHIYSNRQRYRHTIFSSASSSNSTSLPTSSTPTPSTTASSTSNSQISPVSNASTSTTKHKRIAIIGRNVTFEKTEKEISINVEQIKNGIFGMRANAYWDSIGALPLVFAGIGIVALVIKMVKVKGGQFRSGDTTTNRLSVPKSAITSEEQEAELHVFKCGGCGYEMYPARGRESRFFPDNFKCPLCGTPRNQFWDRNDPDDPRNQEDDDDEDNDEIEGNSTDGDGDDDGSNGNGGLSGDDGEVPVDDSQTSIPAVQTTSSSSNNSDDESKSPKSS